MEEVEQTPARSATAWKSEAFARFWEVCWYRRSKDAAWRAFCKVAVTIEIAEDIIRGVKHHGPRLMLEAKQSRRTPIYPATWLHAGGWKDEPEPMLDLVPTNGKPADNLTFRQKDRADEKGMFHHMLAREAQKNG